MAAVAAPADQAAVLLQKLSLDSQAKAFEIHDSTKKPTVYSNNMANRVQSGRSVTPLLLNFTDPTACYVPNGYPYCYGGFDDSEWEDYTRFMNPDGVACKLSAIPNSYLIITAQVRMANLAQIH